MLPVTCSPSMRPVHGRRRDEPLISPHAPCPRCESLDKRYPPIWRQVPVGEDAVRVAPERAFCTLLQMACT
jgi:hypothetical protein